MSLRNRTINCLCPDVSRKSRLIFCVTLIFCLGLVSLLLDTAALIDALPLIYLSVFLLLAIGVYNRKDSVREYFSPSVLMVMYVSLFFFLGSLAFKYELVLMNAGEQWRYYFFENTGMITFYFLCAMCITLISRTLSKEKLFAPRRQKNVMGRLANQNRSPKKRLLLLSALIAILTIFIEIPLPGGEGNFSSTFFMFAIICTSYMVKATHVKYRIFVYVLHGLLLSIFFFEDRRLTAFYIFIVCFIESFDRRTFRIELRKIFLVIFCVAALFVSVIAMSVQRGVGQFESKSALHSFLYVKDYLKSDRAMTMLFHNFEGPATVFHSYNGVDHMMQTGDYQYGSTIVKALFLPIPRDLFEGKPRSMVDQYTAIFFPAYRESGGSYVPNFYTEAFWNFGFAGGLLFLLITFYLFNKIYDAWINRLRNGARVDNLFFLSSYAFLLFLFRGSGFDLFLLFALIFAFMTLLYKLLNLPLMRCTSRNNLTPSRCD